MQEYTNPTETTQEEALYDEAFLSGLLEDDEDYSEAEETEETEETTEGTEEEEEAETEAEETEAEDEEESETKPQGQPQGKPQGKPQGLRIKYNGVEQDITLEQAKELAQKGMDYDKVRAERDSLRSLKVDARATEVFHRSAEANGMNVEEYVSFVENQQKAALLQHEEQLIREKYPDIDEEAVKEMAQMRAQAKAKAMEESAQGRKKSQEEAKQKPWVDFLTRFPEYRDGRPLPEKVVEAIKGGATPVEAMMSCKQEEYEQRIKELEGQLRTKEQNTRNRKKTVGSVNSTVGEKTIDPFLAEFDKD